MRINYSKKEMGIIGICGHVGIGHVHSHSGFVQDDSGGFAVVSALIKKALPINTEISFVDVDINQSMITVKTRDGGIGKAWARRGITPIEAELITRIIGKDAIYTQSTAQYALGRIYGQGVMEVPVALQSAIALSLIDTLEKKWPEEVKIVQEDIELNIGKILGTVIDINDVPVSVLLIVNASEGGIGPVEDLEGNIMLGVKGELMKKLNLHNIPNIIVEGKPYVPAICSNLKSETFWIRANKNSDNLTVASCLVDAAYKLGLPNIYMNDVFQREGGALKDASEKFGERIIELGNKFKTAETSMEKVQIISELAVLISQDAGGVTFMTNSLENIVGGAGMMSGTSAVISLLVSPEYINYWKIPMLTDEDIDKYISIITKAVHLLNKNINKASKELIEKYNFNEKYFDFLF